MLLLLIACARVPSQGLDAADAGVPPRLLREAFAALPCLPPAPRPDRLTLIDYRASSRDIRLWVLGLPDGEVRFATRVTHGKNSGSRRARTFSNVDGSLMTSLGWFLTAELYDGKNGRSLRLDGMEPGINDAARSRFIVMHGADYATDLYLEENGRLGRSWGCPAVDPILVPAIFEDIAGGSYLFAWHPEWEGLSPLAGCDAGRSGVGRPP